MTTPLKGTLKRAIEVDDVPYTIAMNEEGFTLVPKGRRKGLALRWADLVSGDAALARALNASLAATPERRPEHKTEKNDR